MASTLTKRTTSKAAAADGGAELFDPEFEEAKALGKERTEKGTSWGSDLQYVFAAIGNGMNLLFFAARLPRQVHEQHHVGDEEKEGGAALNGQGRDDGARDAQRERPLHRRLPLRPALVGELDEGHERNRQKDGKRLVHPIDHLLQLVSY